MNYMTDGVETDESHDALMNKFTAFEMLQNESLIGLHFLDMYSRHYKLGVLR